jgi:hypothetical protein
MNDAAPHGGGGGDRPSPVLRQLAWHAAALAALLGVFALYAHPDFLVMLADQLWACF